MSKDDSETFTEVEKEKIRVWLAEYEACHSNRNHFDSTYWLIASIFLVASFTLLGLSFQEAIINNVSVVLLMTSFSVFLFAILYFYNVMIQRYIKNSYKRMLEIEAELRSLKLDIQLHTTIDKTYRKGMGILVFATIIIGFFIFVIFRLFILFNF